MNWMLLLLLGALGAGMLVGLGEDGGDDANADPDHDIDGTQQADTLFGSDRDDEISGLGGDDVIRGFEGDDTVLGGVAPTLDDGEEGPDTLPASDGDDLVELGAGDDTYLGWPGGLEGPAAGTDTVFGGEGDDQITIVDGGTADGGAGLDTYTAIRDAGDPVLIDYSPEDELHLDYAETHTGEPVVETAQAGENVEVRLDGQLVAILRGVDVADVRITQVGSGPTPTA